MCVVFVRFLCAYCLVIPYYSALSVLVCACLVGPASVTLLRKIGLPAVGLIVGGSAVGSYNVPPPKFQASLYPPPKFEASLYPSGVPNLQAPGTPYMGFVFSASKKWSRFLIEKWSLFQGGRF